MLLLFLFWLLWVSWSGFSFTKWTNGSISMNLLVTTKTGLHRRRLLLVSEGRRIGNWCDTAVITKLWFRKSQIAKYWWVLTSWCHGEEGILLWGWQSQSWTSQLGFLRFSDRHRPGLWQRLIFFQNSGRFQSVLFFVWYFRQFFQLQQIRPHSVDVLL